MECAGLAKAQGPEATAGRPGTVAAARAREARVDINPTSIQLRPPLKNSFVNPPAAVASVAVDSVAVDFVAVDSRLVTRRLATHPYSKYLSRRLR